MPQPRSCDILRIPYEYCICKGKITQLPEDNDVAKPLAKFIIAHMNMDLLSSPNTSDVCATLSLNEAAPIIVEEYEQKKDASTKVYQITFTTVPGGGQFRGYISRDNNGTMVFLSEKLGRMNSYHAQAQCALRSNFAVYCFCKNLLT